MTSARAPDPDHCGPVARELRTRLASTEAELGAVRYELSRLSSRRLVRVALLMARLLRHPREPLGVLRSLPAVLRGGLPIRDPIPHPAAVQRPPYPHLAIADAGGTPTFSSVAPHLTAESADEVDEPPIDLRIVDLRREPGPEGREMAPSDAPLVVLVDAEDQLEHDLVSDADLVVTEERSLADTARRKVGERLLVQPPSVDITATNPSGWQRAPTNGVLKLTSSTTADEVRDHMVAEADPEKFPSELALVRSVLETVALGTPVVVRPSLRNGGPILARVASMPENIGEHRAEIERLAGDRDERERTSVRTRRTVLTDHSRRARFEEILDRLGIPLRQPEAVSVLLVTNRPRQVGFALQQVTGQDHPRVELVLVLHGEGFDDVAIDRYVDRTPTTVIHTSSDWLLGDCYNAALDRASGTLAAKMDDDDHYGPRHLSDLVLARDYTGAEVVGRTANFIHLSSVDRTVSFDVERQERWDPHHLPGPALLWDADLLRRVRFRRVPRAIDTHALRDAYRVGARVYATHRYQMVRARHGEHTYEEEDRHFLRRAGDQVWTGLRTDIAFT
jgi:hypothetical protein